MERPWRARAPGGTWMEGRGGAAAGLPLHGFPPEAQAVQHASSRLQGGRLLFPPRLHRLHGHGFPRLPSPRWFDHHAFRYLVAVNSIIAVYSFFEMGAALWEMLNGNTLLPEIIQLWFDFTHDQAFAYLLLSAHSSATTLTQNLRSGQICSESSHSSCGGSDAFCIQSYVSIVLGFTAFLFLAASAVLSGFRLACFITTGSRFHV